MTWRDGLLSMLRIRRIVPKESAEHAREEARRLRKAKVRLHLLDVQADIIARRSGKTHR